MNFSEALDAIKAGHRLRRTGWNGVGQFVFLVAGSNFKVNREPLMSILGEGSDVTYRPHIDMRAPDGTIGVWAPQMWDVLADDWEAIPFREIDGRGDEAPHGRDMGGAPLQPAVDADTARG